MLIYHKIPALPADRNLTTSQSETNAKSSSSLMTLPIMNLIANGQRAECLENATEIKAKCSLL